MSSALVYAAAAAWGLLLLASVSDAAFCHGKPHPIGPNTQPISTQLRLVNTTQNAKLYLAGEADDAFWLLHVWGSTGYEYGQAYGEIMAPLLQQFLPRAWSYFEQQVMSDLSKWPEWLAKIIADVGLSAALDFQWALSEPYIDPQVVEEMRGIADAGGVSFKVIKDLASLGEITRGRCSMFGAWGNATAFGKTIQLRALDWDDQGPLQDYATVVVYHPMNSTLGHAFANVGWAGYVGSLTGMSSQQMGVSEIGVSFPDSTFGDESMSGTPFIFVLREILQYDVSLDDALTRMANAHRTCRLILGVGDGKLQKMNILQYSHSKLNIMDDLNLAPVADWHPRIPNIVYEGMDWLCPSYQQALHDQLLKNFGNISPEVTVEDITAIVATGDLHVAIYDLTDLQMFVANARASTESGPLEAYNRQFVHLDLKAAFTEAHP